MSTALKIAPASATQPVPLTAAAELVLGHLELRREGLARYCANALRVTALALAAAHAIAYRYITSLSAASSARMAQYRLSGQRAMGVEDVAALIEEGPLGVEVALALLRVLVARAGGRIVMQPQPEEQPERAHRALASLMAQVGQLADQAVMALADGRIDADEYVTLAPAIEAMRRCVETFDAACVAGQVPHDSRRMH